MSNRDTRFSKGQQYREISDRDLFYDLEYQLVEKDSIDRKTNSVVVYLFFTSVILNFIFDINQILTIGLIVLYGIAYQYVSSYFGSNQRAIGLIVILGVNIRDHYIADLLVLPGKITTDDITTLAWLFEIIWILFYGVEFLTIFAPIQQPATAGRTITPATLDSKKIYKGLRNRVEGSEYAIGDFEEEVDTTLLQSTFRDLVQYVVMVFIGIVLLDIFIWEIISFFSGGENVDESYFVSGMSFVIYTILIIYSGRLFRSGKSEGKSS